MFIKEIRGSKRTVYDIYYSPKETDGYAERIIRFDDLTSALLALKFIRGDNMGQELSLQALRLIKEKEAEGSENNE